MRTLYNSTLEVRALPITAIGINGVRYSSIVDTGVLGNDFRDVLFVLVTGAVTDGTHAVTVEESDSASSGFADVESYRVQGSLPSIGSADDFRVEGLSFGVRPTKQYLRLKITSSGVTSGGTIGAVALLSAGSNAPALRTGS
ncbi:hypothetical protein [Mycobacterium kansasii]|uniref:hypothetical protein n=1 Tax=Mycobacterium kansasii TaxID=1768 RepID=UPI0009EF7ACB|nr:hypothetical protein [Mycobacterium kansasii]ARG91401.1 hypothetical protein B1T50_04615 [Mycobacterium kansasii]